MGELPFIGKQPNDSLMVSTTMLAPEDAEFQQNLFATEYVQSLDCSQNGANLVVPSDIVRTLLHAPSLQAIESEAAERTKRGILAGYVLTFLFVMARYPAVMGSRKQGGVSLGKAFHACSEVSVDPAFHFSDGTSLPRSERKIREAWAEFRPVAHLWAAFVWNLACPVAPQSRWLKPENEKPFLETARFFSEVGRSLQLDNKAKRTKESVMPEGAFWIVPQMYRPIAFIPDSDAAFDNSSMLKAFRSYSATK